MSSIFTLPVPYVPQIGTGANKYSNDCGAASVSMILKAYTGTTPSVDDIYASAGKPYDMYLSFGDLSKLLLASGIATTYFAGIDQLKLFSFLREERPLIALVHYGTLREYINPPSSFTGAHFCVVISADPYSVRIHDPLWSNTGGEHLVVPFDGFMQSWDDSWKDSNTRRSALVPDLGITEFIDTQVDTLYTAKVLTNWLSIRTSPGVSSNNHTGKYLQYGTIVEVYKEQYTGSDLWVAINPELTKWSAARYNNQTYIKEIV